MLATHAMTISSVRCGHLDVLRSINVPIARLHRWRQWRVSVLPDASAIVFDKTAIVLSIEAEHEELE